MKVSAILLLYRQDVGSINITAELCFERYEQVVLRTHGNILLRGPVVVILPEFCSA